MNKLQKLEKLALEIENCVLCKQDTQGKAVPGEGNPDADIVFIGEAPGREEAKTGRPFIGRSGKLLRSLIREVGLKEEDVFITSPVKRLPNRGTPNPAQIAHGREHLNKQFSVIEPKIIVLLGNVACQAVLEEKHAVLKEHATIIKKDGRNYFITLHPAAAIRFQKFKKVIQEDFRKLHNLLYAKLSSG